MRLNGSRGFVGSVDRYEQDAEQVFVLELRNQKFSRLVLLRKETLPCSRVPGRGEDLSLALWRPRREDDVHAR